MSKTTVPVSEQLRRVRREFQEFRHGGVVLSSEDAEGLVHRLDEIITDALNLETIAHWRTWDSQAAEQRQALVAPASVIVLDAFRPHSNVVRFPPRPTPSHQR
ncbi:hypothetical protein [Rhizobium sp. YS-1r]|uniref:hypothetical protein n=1 Tax=Rhizobium sp. YS-1r TaxID=1532558 RepID=UPI00050FA166|nr:hypothetical protein [Rhizobium sp. YS-1r]KGE00980.1 hypothetical protein JL39_07490 [Rhizobium sp. YS-1r]